jgi:predicted adenine nucleotide alpha hydrolase (AANH) superfamily ATPase
MSKALVLDATGKRLSPCSREKALRMLGEGKAKHVTDTPLTIQLPYAVEWDPQHATTHRAERPGEGKRLLLHICCGPCSTYSIGRLRKQGFEVSGFWYNPNIHPFAEHQRRRECALAYASEVDLPMICWEEYEMPSYFQAVVGHETFGERCAICYRLRLERTARAAQQQGFHALTTTLLISPYQQQELIRDIGEELATLHEVEFYFENLRQGWSKIGRIARDHEMYQQHYCGCLYSEWEAADREAITRRRPRK